MIEKISIIVPIYNSEKYLERCISSIIQQTYSNIEIILINDGSTDKSLEICKDFAKKDNRIILYNGKNEGVSNARNRGINLSNGEYITFIDSDDSIDKDYIKCMVENIINEDYLIKYNYNKELKAKTYHRDKFLKKIIQGNVFGACWGYLFSKKILKDIYFDSNTSYMEDAIFIVEYLLRVKYVKILKEGLYHYNYNIESLTNSNNNMEKKLNGYIYSINKIENILIENSKYNDTYEKYLNNRKVSILEGVLSKIDEVDKIKEIINKRKIKEIIYSKKIPIKLILFINLIRKEDYKNILLYIKIRKLLKLIIKRKQ